MENSDIPDPRYQDTYRRLPDLAKLRDALAPLSIRHRLAFALCCCEHLYPSYQALAAFLQTPNLLRPILDRLWKQVFDQEMTEAEVEQALATCQSLQLGEDDCCEHFWEAVNAADATIVTLNACKEHTLDNVVRAAELAREKVFQPLWDEITDPNKGGIGPEEGRQIRDAIRSHPAMVAEVEKEAAQLRFLYECEALTESAVAQLLGL
jgi:hypothetical protein